MISETVKVNDREQKEILSPIDRQSDLNYTMPDALQRSIDVEQEWNKFSPSKHNHTTMVEPTAESIGSPNFNSVRDSKVNSSVSHYQTNNPKTSISTYGAALPKKKGHITNLSYSSRPKTTHYLSNGKRSTQHKKPQAASFMTQSMDNTKTPKNVEASVKKSFEGYESVERVSTGKKSPALIDDPSSSARNSAYSRIPKAVSRTVKQQQSVSMKETESKNTDLTPEADADDMKTYRGPFSVSCSTTKDPATVMNDMIRSLDLYSVAFHRQGNYMIKCQKSNIKFEMELTKMENLEFVYIVRILRTFGDINKYRDVAGRILSAMKL